MKLLHLSKYEMQITQNSEPQNQRDKRNDKNDEELG
jgi:hypothetical protein